MITCLYVDDEPELLDLGKEFLESMDGISAIISDSPAKVLGILRSGGIDVIISDYQMEEMDGISLFKSVRGAGFDIPFILFTGRGREEVVIDALNAGVDFYIKKGGDTASQFAELENIIRQLVRRRQAEDAVSHNARRFGRIIENVLDIILIVDLKGMIRYASPSVLQNLGYNPEEMVGTNGLDLINPGDHYEHADPALAPDRISEFRLQTKDGSFRWFEGAMILSQTESGEREIIISAWNIDERKRLEIDVQDRERMLRALFDNSGEYLLITDLNGRVHMANKRLCDVLCLVEKDVVGKISAENMSPPHRELALKLLRDKASGSTERTMYRMTLHDRKGRKRNVNVSSQRVDYQGGEPLVIIGGVDTTELDEINDELVRMGDFRDRAVNDAEVIMIGFDSEGKITMFNRMAEDFSGIPAAIVLGKDIRDVIHVDSGLTDIREEADLFIKDGSLNRPTYLTELQNRDGETRKILWKSWKVMSKGDHQGAISCGIDVTGLNDG